MKKKVTTSLALKAIYKRFAECCRIINVSEGAILDILALDLHSGRYYEIWSNAAWDRLYIEPVTFINESK